MQLSWVTWDKNYRGTEGNTEELKSTRVIAGVGGGKFVGSSIQNEDQTEKEKKKDEEEGKKETYFNRDYYRNLWTKAGNEIGHGCSQGRDVGSAVTLEGKILTVVNKFLTTSPLVNKVKLLMVS